MSPRPRAWRDVRERSRARRRIHFRGTRVTRQIGSHAGPDDAWSERLQTHLRRRTENTLDRVFGSKSGPSERKADHQIKPSSANKSVVPVVIANPEPEQPVWNLDGKGAMVQPNPSRPEAARLFKPKRRVLRILLENFKRSVGKLANVQVERVISFPKRRSSAVSHRSVDRFSEKSFRA